MFVSLGKQIEALGCNSLCIKDMAGIMSPQECYDLVTALRKNIKLPVYVHTHATTGLGYMTYLKAAEAGAAGIDCATSCFSGGTSQPATESLVYALAQMGFDCGVDSKQLKKVNDFFLPVKDKFSANGLFDPYVLSTKTDALNYQIPGGMLSNLVAQLKAQNAIDKLEAVLEETPRVREDMGYPPLVTPLSQMVGVQATVNVLLGERYKSIGKEIKSYIKGEYGKAPGKIAPELAKKVLGDEQPMTGRFADTLKPEFEEAKAYLGSRARSEEDVLSYIAFPQQAEQYFDRRDQTFTASYSFKEVG